MKKFNLSQYRGLKKKLKKFVESLDFKNVKDLRSVYGQKKPMITCRIERG
ncbi:hypothetical protein LCGC14_1389570 [marine sediment metagenome]|uniref:Uncharacterized protein n=1 Tax=marine sediment metagenome TaxID=412755 RepID=A0A0F9K0K1_9ZZZZ